MDGTALLVPPSPGYPGLQDILAFPIKLLLSQSFYHSIFSHFVPHPTGGVCMREQLRD